MVANTKSENSVLVSVGIPVRNGEKTLSLAIESIINQTYKNLEIIISDNNSSDETEIICKKYIDKDSRITYYRQEMTITAIENFRFVFDKSEGKYFMWSADDDLRTENFVETLLHSFESYPEASIVFSDAIIFDENNRRHVSTDNGSQGDFDSRGLSFIDKHIKQRRSICLHVYGLINSHYLHDFPWFDIDYAPDFPLLHWLLCCGDFVYTPGSIFYYFQEAKTFNQMAVSNSLRSMRSFHLIRFSYVCTKSIIKAQSKKWKYFNNMFSYIYFFFFFYFPRHGGLVGFSKQIIYPLLPLPFKLLWKKCKESNLV